MTTDPAILDAIFALHMTIKRQHENTGPLGLFLDGKGMMERGGLAGYRWAEYQLEMLDDEDPQVVQGARKAIKRAYEISPADLPTSVGGMELFQFIFSAIYRAEEDGDKKPGIEDIRFMLLIDLGQIDGDRDQAEVLRNLDLEFARWFIDDANALLLERGVAGDDDGGDDNDNGPAVA